MDSEENVLNYSGPTDRSSAGMKVTVHQETQEIIESGNLIESETSINSTLDLEFHATPYRWLVHLFYVLSCMLGPFLSMTITPQALLIKEAYGVTLYAVTFCSLCFGYAGVFMNLVSMNLYVKLPLSWGLRFGASIMLFGCWLRGLSSLIGNEFWPIMAGFVFVGASGPLLHCPVNIISNRWFPDSQRAIATALGTLSIPLGTFVAFV